MKKLKEFWKEYWLLGFFLFPVIISPVAVTAYHSYPDAKPISTAIADDEKPFVKKNFFLTNNIKVPTVNDYFDCEDIIFVVALEVAGSGEHILEVEWISPSGERKYSRNNFFIKDNPVDAWVWLKLKAGTGGKFFSRIDPSAGMDGFIGQWKARIFLDGKFAAAEKFTVVC